MTSDLHWLWQYNAPISTCETYYVRSELVLTIPCTCIYMRNRNKLRQSFVHLGDRVPRNGTQVKRWYRYAHRRNSSTVSPPVTEAVNFLANPFQSGLGYYTIGVAGSALSFYLDIQGGDISVWEGSWKASLNWNPCYLRRLIYGTST